MIIQYKVFTNLNCAVYCVHSQVYIYHSAWLYLYIPDCTYISLIFIYPVPPSPHGLHPYSP